MTENAIGTIVVGAAIAVHRELGPGLLETVHEVTLARELEARGLTVDRQVPVAITYKGIRFVGRRLSSGYHRRWRRMSFSASLRDHLREMSTLKTWE